MTACPTRSNASSAATARGSFPSAGSAARPRSALRARVPWRPRAPRPCRPLLLVLASGAAATIHGSKQGELIAGTPAADRVRRAGRRPHPGRLRRRDGSTAARGSTSSAPTPPTRRVELRGRLAAPVGRPLHERGQPARDRSRARQLLLRVDRGRRVPGRAPRGRSLLEHRHGRLGRRGPNLAALVPPRRLPRTHAGGPGDRRFRPGSRLRRGARRVARQHARDRALVSHVSSSRSPTAKLVAAGRRSAAPLLDKEWIACDNGASSPFRGRCYLEYSDDVKDITVSQFSTTAASPGRRRCARARSSSAPSLSCAPTGRSSSSPATIAARQALSGSMVALRSTDGGATFARIVVSDLQAANNDPMRAISLPSVDADSNGTIYAVWHDCRFRASCARNDMVISTSSDGLTWTAPVRIPLAPAASTPRLHPRPRGGPRAARTARCSCTRTTMPARARRCLPARDRPRAIADAGKKWSVQPLDAQPYSTTWLPRAEGGRMVGDYFSTRSRAIASCRFSRSLRRRSEPLPRGIFAVSLRALG